MTDDLLSKIKGSRPMRSILKSMPKTSYPKKNIRVLLLENIHSDAIASLHGESFQIDSYTQSMSEDELIEKIETVHLLGIRSRTQVTAKVLEHARRLWAIGCFCIGTNQVDLEQARRQGVPVFNAPYSNTRSVAELVIGEIIMLVRRVIEKNNRLHQGEWDKSSEGSHEIRGKTLGIIGYGHIGSQVSILAEALGMNVIYFDIAEKLPMGNATAVGSLAELLQRSEVVTLHVPEDKTTFDLIGAEQLALMKRGSYLLNLSRGRVVTLNALRHALTSGHLAGAAVDVFPTEPQANHDRFESELQGLSNLILTPHIGGSTAESQKDIGIKTSEKLIKYMNTGTSVGAVNFPELQLPVLENRHRVLHIHRNVPGVVFKFSNVFAEAGVNIESQILKTLDDIGYLVTDVDRVVEREIVEPLKKMTETIRVRVLY